MSAGFGASGRVAAARSAWGGLPREWRSSSRAWPVAFFVTWGLSSVAAAQSEPPPGERLSGALPGQAPDRSPYDFQGVSETYVPFFRQALLPGPNGAVVDTTTSSPLTQYVSARALRVDSPWHEDAISVDASLWGSLVVGDAYGGRQLDGDITSLNVTYRAYQAFVRAGRQTFAGGAARFARFDGASAGWQSESGFGLEGYGGWTVLPRWDAQPGYHHLGTAADSILKDPQYARAVDRGGYWLAGARAHYAHGDLAHVGLSFHEQQEESALSRRSLGADFRIAPLKHVTLSGTGVFDVDSSRVADGRIWMDFVPIDELSVSIEALDTTPALFLSRQSVLSVFGGDSFQEIGGTVRYDPWTWLRAEADGYYQVNDGPRPAARTGLGVRIKSSPDGRFTLRLNGRRVSSYSNGYWLFRNAWRYRVSVPWTVTADFYGYFYDEPIAGYSVSLVALTNVEYEVASFARLLVGGSLSHTPYAAMDGRALVRAVLTWDDLPGGVE